MASMIADKYNWRHRHWLLPRHDSTPSHSPCFAGLFTARELIYDTSSSTPKLQKPFTLITHGSSLKPTTEQTCQRIAYRSALRVYVLLPPPSRAPWQMRLQCLLTIVELVSSLKPALKITQSRMAVNWSSNSQRWAGVQFCHAWMFDRWWHLHW